MKYKVAQIPSVGMMVIEDENGILLSPAEVAGLLNSLEQRLAAAEAKIPKWIPVSEALPPYFDSVLAIRENCTGRPYYATRYNDKKWCDIVSTEVIDVTHWMPLHEVPKIGKGE